MRLIFALFLGFLATEAYAAKPSLQLVDDCGPIIERICPEGSRQVPIQPRRGLHLCTELQPLGSACGLPKGTVVCVVQPGFRCVGGHQRSFVGRKPTYRRCTTPRTYACPL